MKELKIHIVIIIVFMCSSSSIFLLSCGGEQSYNEAIQETSDDFAAVVGETVTDPDRAAMIIELFNRSHDSHRAMYMISQEYHKEVRKLNADYDATPEQFRKLYGEYDEAWIMTRNHILENLFEMKKHTTEDE